MNSSSALEARWYTNKRNIASIVSLCIYGIALTILLVRNPSSMLDYAFFGGLIGLLSTAIVIYDFVRSRGALLASQNLLLYRALSDAGIAMRFLLYRSFNKQLCGEFSCGLDESWDKEDRCGLAAGVLQFFESASEAWFVCISFDMLVSLSNPFSSFQDRMKKYHLFVWTYAAVMALVMGFDHDLHGFFYIDQSLDDTAFCWISSYNGESTLKINFRPWVFLYIPLFIVFAVSIGVIIDSYKRLRRGISRTFQRRLKAFLGNFKNIIIYSVYWCINIILFLVGYSYNYDVRASQYGYKLLFFMIASKGFCDLWIWIWISENGILDEKSTTTSIQSNGESFDSRVRTASIKDAAGGDALGDGVAFNQMLRQEVLYYITTGIRSSTQRSSKCKPGVKKFTYKLSKPLTEKEDIFRQGFFYDTIFRRMETLDQMLQEKSRPNNKSSRTNQGRRNEPSNSEARTTQTGSNIGSPSGSRVEYSSDLEASRLIVGYSDSIRFESTQSSRSLGSSFNIASNSGRVSDNDTTSDGAARMTDGEIDGSAIDDGVSERESTMRPSDAGIVGMIRSFLIRKPDFYPQGNGGTSQNTSQNAQTSSAVAAAKNARKSALAEALLGNVDPEAGVGDASHDPPVDRLTAGAYSQADDQSHPSTTRGTQQQNVQVVEEFDAAGGDGSFWSFLRNLTIFRRSGDILASNSPKNAADELQRSQIKAAAVRFVAYNPPAFRRIRAASGVAEDEFVSAFSETVKERLLSGGASGAFFFFSKDEMYIAKSCTLTEMITIRENAEQLAEYFEANPLSCIARIYGAYLLHIYGTDLHFYVMQNIFKGKSLLNGINSALCAEVTPSSAPTVEVINEKYDIKGSWVDRNAQVPSEGQLVTCSNCNQKFEFVRPESAIRRLNRLGLRRNRRVAQNNEAIVAASATETIASSSNPMTTNTNTTAWSSNSMFSFGPGTSPPVMRSSTLAGGEFVTDFSSMTDDGNSNAQPKASKGMFGAAGDSKTGTTTSADPGRVLSGADRPPPSRLASRSAISVVSDVIFMRSFASSLDTLEATQHRCPNTAHGRHEPNIVLKDNDLKHKLKIPSNLANLLIDQLDKDAKMLCDVLQVMDYSLLVGVHNTEYVVDETDNSSEAGERSTRSRRPAASTRFPVSRVVGPASYYIGIVDFQQKWTFSKKVERLLKAFFFGADPAGLSAAPPDQYKERFLRRIEDLLDFDDENDDGAVNTRVPNITATPPSVTAADANGPATTAPQMSPASMVTTTAATPADSAAAAQVVSTPPSRQMSTNASPPNVVLRRRSVSDYAAVTPPT